MHLRAPFAASEWSDYIDEREADLRFEIGKKSLTLPEILHVANNDPDAAERAKDPSQGRYPKG